MLHCKTVWWKEGTKSCCLLFTLISWWRRSPGERRDHSLPGIIFYPSSQIPHPKTWCFLLPTKKINPMRRWQLHPEELQETLHTGILPSQKSLQPILSSSKSIPAPRKQLRILLADPVVWRGRKSSSLRAVSGASVVWLVFLAGYGSLLFLSCFVGFKKKKAT